MSSSTSVSAEIHAHTRVQAHTDAEAPKHFGGQTGTLCPQLQRWLCTFVSVLSVFNLFFLSFCVPEIPVHPTFETLTDLNLGRCVCVAYWSLYFFIMPCLHLAYECQNLNKCFRTTKQMLMRSLSLLSSVFLFGRFSIWPMTWLVQW